MKILKGLLVVILIIGLVMVRKYETQLFYDPVLAFFKGDFHHADFPEIQLGKHLLSISSRYALNAVITLGIIQLIFNDIKILKFSFLILLIFFVPFIALYFYFIHIEFKEVFTAGFYVRRFLLQPIMLLILVPAIWFYKKQKEA